MAQRFGDLLCLHLQGRCSEETSVDKTSVPFSRSTLNQSTRRTDRRRSEIYSSHSGLAEVSDVRRVVGRVYADVSSLYYRDSLAALSGHPLPSSAIPFPPTRTVVFGLLKRKAL